MEHQWLQKNILLPNSNNPTDAAGELEFYRTKKTAKVDALSVCGFNFELVGIPYLGLVV